MVGRVVLYDLGCCSCNHVHLLLVCVGACQKNVIQHFLAIQTIATCDFDDSLRSTRVKTS